MDEMVAIENIAPGDIVRAYGTEWRVMVNIDDPHGNTGHQHRRVLVCYDRAAHLPASRMTIGRLVGMEVTRVRRA